MTPTDGEGGTVEKVLKIIETHGSFTVKIHTLRREKRTQINERSLRKTSARKMGNSPNIETPVDSQKRGECTKLTRKARANIGKALPAANANLRCFGSDSRASSKGQSTAD